jgi:hypothetical protein
MSEHTLEPWEANGNGVHKRVSNHYAACVAVCEGEKRYANAKLIAAAPELLKALQDILIFDSALSQENARAAIRKAIGESE